MYLSNFFHIGLILFLFHLVFDTHETSFLSSLVPIFEPIIWADTDGPLTVNLALVVGVTGLFHTKEPFVVPVPAMQGLILGRKTLITGCGTYILHLM